LVQGNYPKVKDKQIHTEGSYEYLLKLPLFSFTDEEIAKLEAQNDHMVSAYQRLQGLTVEEIWCQELDECVTHLK